MESDVHFKKSTKAMMVPMLMGYEFEVGDERKEEEWERMEGEE